MGPTMNSMPLTLRVNVVVRVARVPGAVGDCDLHRVLAVREACELRGRESECVGLISDGVLDGVNLYVVEALYYGELVGGVRVVDREGNGGRARDGAEVGVAAGNGRVYIMDDSSARAREVAAVCA